MYYTGWTKVWFDSAALAFEAGEVIGLRLHRLAGMDSAALREANLMVAEKMQTAFELNAMALTGALGSSPGRQATRTVSKLRTKVARNRRRLKAAAHR